MKIIKDRLNRNFEYLRISVTDKCNYRCMYCMPKDKFGSNHIFLQKDQLLTYEEIIEATFDCSKTGLNSKIGKFKSQELAIELLKIAKTGLKKRNFLNSSGDNETGYLSPLFNMAEEGKTLADNMLQKYLKDWNKDPKKAIENQII